MQRRPEGQHHQFTGGLEVQSKRLLGRKLLKMVVVVCRLHRPRPQSLRRRSCRKVMGPEELPEEDEAEAEEAVVAALGLLRELMGSCIVTGT